MMAGKNQAALAVCAQTEVIFPFKKNLSPMGAYFSSCNVRNSVKLDIQTLIVFPLMHILREKV